MFSLGAHFCIIPCTGLGSKALRQSASETASWFGLQPWDNKMKYDQRLHKAFTLEH